MDEIGVIAERKKVIIAVSPVMGERDVCKVLDKNIEGEIEGEPIHRHYFQDFEKQGNNDRCQCGKFTVDEIHKLGIGIIAI